MLLLSFCCVCPFGLAGGGPHEQGGREDGRGWSYQSQPGRHRREVTAGPLTGSPLKGSRVTCVCVWIVLCLPQVVGGRHKDQAIKR